MPFWKLVIQVAKFMSGVRYLLWPDKKQLSLYIVHPLLAPSLDAARINVDRIHERRD